MSGILVPVDGERFETMETVATLSMQGMTEGAIARQLSLKRAVVKELLAEYKQALAQDSESRDRARDALHMMAEHYDRLILESYKILDELKAQIFNTQVSAQLNTTLKNIAEFEAKRLDAWHKAGMLEVNDLGDDMAAMEERHEILISILRNDLCPTCRANVAHKLQKVTQQVEAVVIYEE